MDEMPLPSAILETCLDATDLQRSSEFDTGLFGYSVMKSDDRFCAMSVDGRQVLILFRRGSDPDGHLLELLTPGVWPVY